MIEVATTPREARQQILREVLCKHGMTEDEFFGPARPRYFTAARAEAAQRLDATGMSVPRIAEFLQLDRKTVYYYLKKPERDRRHILRAAQKITPAAREVLAFLAIGQKRPINDIIIEWVTERAMAEQARLQMLEAA
jgi:predicted transcriptional regulator